MVWNGARRLILPAALTVTTFVVAGAVASCSGGDTQKKSSAVAACKDVPSDACQKCKDNTGNVICGPSSNCYDAAGDTCVYGSSG